MSQLKILTNNVADIATITVANTAAGMGASKLKTDIKGEVCRILSGTASIVLQWSSLQTVEAVVIPASSLGPSSTIRVRTYSDETGVNMLHDTGKTYAAPGGILGYWDFSQPLNVNQFAFGFAPETAVYLSEHYAVRRVVIDIVDPAATFIDISRLIVGPSTTTAYNAIYGQSDGLVDLTQNSRAASGDLKTDYGPKAKTLSFSLDFIDGAYRSKIKRILDLGIGRFIWVSIMSESDDPELQRDKSIYGKLTQPQAMQWANYAGHTAQFEIEGF